MTSSVLLSNQDSSPPMARMFGLALPTPFGVPHDWIMLLFATPIAVGTPRYRAASARPVITRPRA